MRATPRIPAFCHRALGLGLLACLVQCQSGPERILSVRAGQPTSVTLGFDGGTLEMVNSTGVRSADADQLRRQRPGLKIIADTEMQKLLDVLGQQEFFAHTTPRLDRRAKSYVLVAADGQRWIGSGIGTGPDTARNVEQIQRFSSWVEAVRVFYNRTENFTTAQLREEELKRSSEQINRASEEVRSKREGRNRNP